MASAFVFGGFHDFPFSRSFVVNAAKVQDAVDDDAVQLPFVVIAGKLFGVGAYRIQADEEVAAQAVAFAVVESDDVRVVIVLKVLAVHFEDFLVRTEDVGYFADSLVVGGGNGFDPFRCFALLDCGHFDAVCPDNLSYYFQFFLKEEYIADDDSGDDTGKVGYQAAGDGVAGFRDAYAAEVDGKDVERGIRGMRATQLMRPTKESAVLLHCINHQSVGPAAA